MRKNFWTNIPLNELTSTEWEALCDGCGKCCLLKLEDEDTGRIEYTSIACRLFDDTTCQCGNYPLRTQLVKSCVTLHKDGLTETIHWMPNSCAYKLRYENKQLPNWHPLVTGEKSSTLTSGNSVQGKTIPEYSIEDKYYEDYLWEGINE